MNHKKIAIIAVIMAVVFGVIVTAYPLMFNPENEPGTSPSPVEATPVNQ
ncbi:MAG: hypothetical protein V4736_11860 [Bdellovibrionota bacterium]